MLDEYIENSEYLYRRVILNPNFWDFDNNKPTSAIYKDSYGVSVDRQSDRTDESIIEVFKKLPIRAVVKIQAQTCRYLDTLLVYKPVEDNIFHSEIHDSLEKIQINSSKAKKLRDNSTIIYLNENE